MFKLRVMEGEFTDSQIVVMLGENGTGKTTFIRMLTRLRVRMQKYLNSMFLTSPRKSSIRALLHQKIHDSFMHPQFASDVMKPLQIEQLMDQEVVNLSGGELQRVASCLYLGKVCIITFSLL
ncbi:hypothetical protein MKW94_029403 [Papaver nudicaule]|uniref:ABC transporter domain-containing protein n=1 Tax=Papaver nudicaule TaxID=74823 RepID=A0AA41VYH7_PAPNU|nr:hypothetical protein [Papaver nudicaule]